MDKHLGGFESRIYLAPLATAIIIDPTFGILLDISHI
jgi:hypothetical protein